MTTGGSYYWAGGRKIALQPADEVVVDLDADTPARTGQAVAELRAKGRPLTRGLVMVSRADAEEAIGDATTSAPGVHSVYRTDDGTLLAVLPEVRVEGSPEVLSSLGDRSGAHVTERNADRVVLRPDSGRGEDALALANELAEEGGAEVSQARFLRVVHRPEPRG